jgi:hypothetical protein
MVNFIQHLKKLSTQSIQHPLSSTKHLQPLSSELLEPSDMQFRELQLLLQESIFQTSGFVPLKQSIPVIIRSVQPERKPGTWVINKLEVSKKQYTRIELSSAIDFWT